MDERPIPVEPVPEDVIDGKPAVRDELPSRGESRGPLIAPEEPAERQDLDHTGIDWDRSASPK